MPFKKMDIEYRKLPHHPVWVAFCNNELLAKIAVHNAQNSYDMEPGTNKVYVFDHSKGEPQQLPKSPFETLNTAKAALEYHFRHLISIE